MGRFRKRSLLAGASATALALMLVACGGGEPGGGGGGGGGKTLNVLIGANTQFPEEQQAWQSDPRQVQGADRGDRQVRDVRHGQRRADEDPDSVVSGSGPDVYASGTTFTPTAYSTRAFVKLGDEEWEKIGGKDKFVPATLGISGPDEQNQVGIPWVSRPFVMAYNTELLKAAGIDKPATTWDELAQQAKQLTKGDQYGLAVGLQGQLRPVEVHLGHGGPGRQPAGGRQDSPARRPDRQEGVRDLLRLADQGQGRSTRPPSAGPTRRRSRRSPRARPATWR